MSKHLVQSIRLLCSGHNVHVSGIAESLGNCPVQSIANFKIVSTHLSRRKIDLTAIVLPKVTCDLLIVPVPVNLSWTYLSGLPLADLAFGEPQCANILLEVDDFVDIICQGWQIISTKS